MEFTKEIGYLEKFRRVEAAFEFGEKFQRWMMLDRLYIVQFTPEANYCFDVEDLLQGEVKVIEDRFIATLMYKRGNVVLFTAEGQQVLTKPERLEIKEKFDVPYK